MSQVALQTSDLVERLEQAANNQQLILEELLDEAVNEFLEKWATKKSQTKLLLYRW